MAAARRDHHPYGYNAAASDPSTWPPSMLSCFERVLMDPRSDADELIHATWGIRKLIEAGVVSVDFVCRTPIAVRWGSILLDARASPTLHREVAGALSSLPIIDLQSSNSWPFTAGIERGLVLRLQHACDRGVSAACATAIDTLSWDTHIRERLVEGGALAAFHSCVSDLLASPSNGIALHQLQRVLRNFRSFLCVAPLPSLAKMESILPLLVDIVAHADEEVVVAQVLQMVSFLTAHHVGMLTGLVVDHGLLPRLIDILEGDNSDRLVLEALHTVGNIAAGSDDVTAWIVEPRTLKALRSLLTHADLKIKKEAWCVCSNIACGPPAHLDCMMDADFFELIVNNINAREMEVRIEALHAAFNMGEGGLRKHVEYLVALNVLDALRDALSSGSHLPVSIALNAIDVILRFEQGTSFPTADPASGNSPPFTAMLRDNRTHDQINELLLDNASCNDDDVREQARRLLATYFATDERRL